MQTSSLIEKNTEHPSARLNVIAAIAALMGLGQGGLLVSLPALVLTTGLSLPTWSMIIAVGSVLFLPASPYWGRQSDMHGPKAILLQALMGFSLSFGLMFLFVSFYDSALLSPLLLVIGLIIARVIYGVTVAGMVPAAQHWAVMSVSENQRLEAITTISAGLSTGRLCGPLLAVLLLSVHPLAPLMALMLLPLIALIFVVKLSEPKRQFKTHHQDNPEGRKVAIFPPVSLLFFLLTAAFGAAAIGLMQYTLSPLLILQAGMSLDMATQGVGYLLTLSAAVTLLTQIFVVKKKRVRVENMYLMGGSLMLVGFSLFFIPDWRGVSLACVLVAIGGAMLVPAYTASAMNLLPTSQGVISGYIAMAHTVGYGLAALLALTLAFHVLWPVSINVALAGLVVVMSLCVRRKPHRTE